MRKFTDKQHYLKRVLDRFEKVYLCFGKKYQPSKNDDFSKPITLLFFEKFSLSRAIYFSKVRPLTDEQHYLKRVLDRFEKVYLCFGKKYRPSKNDDFSKPITLLFFEKFSLSRAIYFSKVRPLTDKQHYLKRVLDRFEKV